MSYIRKAYEQLECLRCFEIMGYIEVNTEIDHVICIDCVKEMEKDEK